MEHSKKKKKTVLMATVKKVVFFLTNCNHFVNICTNQANIMLLHPVIACNFISEQKEDFSGGSDV